MRRPDPNSHWISEKSIPKDHLHRESKRIETVKCDKPDCIGLSDPWSVKARLGYVNPFLKSHVIGIVK